MHAAARALIGTFVSALVLVAPPAPARANTTDAYIDRARAEYERVIERLCANTRHAIEQKRAAARRAGDQRALDAIDRERQRFDLAGELPDVPSRAQIQREYARAAAMLLKAFQEAQAKYERQGLSEHRRALSDDAESFATQWDLIPWSDDLLAGEDEQARTVPAGAFRMIPATPGHDYRVHVRARTLGEQAALRVGLPIAEASTRTVQGVPDARGEFLVVLTVRGQRIASDLGAPRPPRTDPIENSRGDAIIIYADNAPIFIESVRFKPLIEGAPPDLDDLAEKPAPGDDDGPRKRFTVGMTGVGGCIHHVNADATMRTSVTVDRVEGNEIDLRATVETTGETIRITCAVNGKRLTVRNVEQIKPPKGKARFHVNRVIGGAGVYSDATLNLSWSVRGDSPRTPRNRVWKFQLVDIEFN